MKINKYLEEATLSSDVPNPDMKIGDKRPMNIRLKKRLHKALDGKPKRKKDGTGPNPD